MTKIKPEQIWKHKNGNLYKVVMLVNTESKRPEEYPPSVVYRRLREDTVWCRPISQWHSSFTLFDGQK